MGGTVRRWLPLVAGIALALGGCDTATRDAPPAARPGTIFVSKGETVYDVARRYGVPVRDLIDLNRLTPPFRLESGQPLLLPVPQTHVVKAGESLYVISRQYQVDLSTLVALNGIAAPFTIHPGQTLKLPRRVAPSESARLPRQVASSPSTPADPAPARSVNRAPVATVERVEPPPSRPSGTDSLGTTAPRSPNSGGERSQRIPGSEARTVRKGIETEELPALPAGTTPPPSPSPASPTPQAQRPSAPSTPGETEAAVRQPSAPMEAAKRDPAPGPAVSPGAPPASATVGPQTPRERQTAAVPPPPPSTLEPGEAPPPPRGGRFLWPLKGQVLSDFGPKPDGLHNDGINIAATRGTPVVAAENGVVAYAGNELKGFGNLLLIRHAGGWVTAYAHLDQTLVTAGATVKRGERIGTVGQTGNVREPQLHFEIRRGSDAIDPRPQLDGGVTGATGTR